MQILFDTINVKCLLNTERRSQGNERKQRKKEPRVPHRAEHFQWPIKEMCGGVKSFVDYMGDEVACFTEGDCVLKGSIAEWRLENGENSGCCAALGLVEDERG